MTDTVSVLCLTGIASALLTLAAIALTFWAEMH